MKKNSNLVTGIAWYRREEYELLHAISADATSMADTYDAWLAGVTKLQLQLQERGMSIRKVDIDVRELLAWCEQQGRPLDGKARSEFVAEKVRKMETGG